jgi:hypothetical protein
MKILQQVWTFVKGLFSKTGDEVKEHIPTAIRVVEGIKKVMDGPVDDIIFFLVKAAIPGPADDLIIDRVKAAIEKALPLVLSQMYLIESIAGIQDKNLQLQAILDVIKLSPDESKAMFYHNLCSMILTALADGKLTLGEAFQISQYAYDNRIELKIVPAAA